MEEPQASSLYLKMKLRNKIIVIVIAFAIVASIVSFLEITTSAQPSMSLEEFEEQFGNEDIVKHFQSVYYDAGTGWGKSPGMLIPEWGYVSAKNSTISELRLGQNFGKYEFTYTCSDLGTDQLYLKIKNPSKQDISENPCWDIHNPEEDGKALDEINQQGILYQKNGDTAKFSQQMILMQEKQTEVASRYLGIKISDAYIFEDYNFPFRDASEITLVDPQSQTAICDVAPNIPAQLMQIRDSEMFPIFIEKYSQHPIILEISDERNHIYMVHYTIIATLENENRTASTYFHVDSCSNQPTENYYNLHCYYGTPGEFTHTNLKEEVISSLEDAEFCTIYLEPWKQDLLEYNKKISEQIDRHFEKLDSIKEEANFEEVMEFNLELDRFVLLGHLVDEAMEKDFEGEQMQKMMKQYNETYGDLPEEFLSLIEFEN